MSGGRRKEITRTENLLGKNKGGLKICHGEVRIKMLNGG